MTAMIRTVRLEIRNGKQAIDLPKRARPLYIYRDGEKIAMDCVQDEDADTRAFDVNHQRYFEVITRGDVCPAGAHVGSICQGTVKSGTAFHVYEVRGR